MTIKREIISKETFVLNVSLLAFLLITVYFSPLRPTDEILFYTSDAKTYYNSGSEVFHLDKTGDSLIRPFLISSFIFWAHKIGGAWLIVILHSIMWLLSGNLIYFGLKKVFEKKWIPILGVALFAIHLSLLAYIFHGLTEVITTFILSIISYITLRTIMHEFNASYFAYTVLLLAILTVIKPLFYYPFLACFVLTIIAFLKSIIQSRRLMLVLVSALTIIGTQLYLMHQKYGEVKISYISQLTFDKYILAQTIREVKQISDIGLSQEIALNMSSKEKKEFIKKHSITFIKLYRTNIKENITGYGTSIILPPKYSIKGYVDFVSEYNKILYVAFLVLLPIFLLICLTQLIRRNLKNILAIILFAILFYYIIFTSGISFWQADRLVLFALPLWISLYFLLFKWLANEIGIRQLLTRKQV